MCFECFYHYHAGRSGGVVAYGSGGESGPGRGQEWKQLSQTWKWLLDNVAASLDIIPPFRTRQNNWRAQLGGGILVWESTAWTRLLLGPDGVNVIRSSYSLIFSVRTLWLVVFENQW
jgi:hypothetical protein